MDKYLIPSLLGVICTILLGGYSELAVISKKLQSFEVLVSQRVTAVEIKLDEHLKNQRTPPRERLSDLPKAVIKPEPFNE